MVLVTEHINKIIKQAQNNKHSNKEKRTEQRTELTIEMNYFMML